MQAIGTKKMQRAEPQKLVLLAAGALLAIMCAVVLVAATLSSGGTTVQSTSQDRPAVTVAQGSGQHARSEQSDSNPTVNGAGDSGVSQPDHGFIP